MPDRWNAVGPSSRSRRTHARGPRKRERVRRLAELDRSFQLASKNVDLEQNTRRFARDEQRRASIDELHRGGPRVRGDVDRVHDAARGEVVDGERMSWRRVAMVRDDRERAVVRDADGSGAHAGRRSIANVSGVWLDDRDRVVSRIDHDEIAARTRGRDARARAGVDRDERARSQHRGQHARRAHDDHFACEAFHAAK